MRPTSYVTRIPGAAAWRKIMDDYRANGPTLGIPAAANSHVTRQFCNLEEIKDGY